MSTSWYYVDGSERVGPVEASVIDSLFQQGSLAAQSYVWKKGFENWEHLEKVEDFQYLFEVSLEEREEFPPVELSSDEALSEESQPFNWESLGEEDRVISIKIGYDRGVAEAEYGPFSLVQLEQAFREKRINEKTFIYIPGMSDWILLGDMPHFERVSGGFPPEIREEDRRANQRKPFVAKMFFADKEAIFEGVCRDISVGGLQVLVAHAPAKVGEVIQMNVHPDNTQHCFVASGKIVRLLEGGAGFSLRFEELSDEAERTIKNYLDSY